MKSRNELCDDGSGGERDETASGSGDPHQQPLLLRETHRRELQTSHRSVVRGRGGMQMEVRSYELLEHLKSHKYGGSI